MIRQPNQWLDWLNSSKFGGVGCILSTTIHKKLEKIMIDHRIEFFLLSF